MEVEDAEDAEDVEGWRLAGRLAVCRPLVRLSTYALTACRSWRNTGVAKIAIVAVSFAQLLYGERYGHIAPVHYRYSFPRPHQATANATPILTSGRLRRLQ